MRTVAKPLAVLLSLVILASPCLADIIPTETDRTRDASAKPVHAQLSLLGVSPSEAGTIVSKLSADQIQFFADNQRASAVVGQEDLIVMFWYEWILAAGSIVLAYYLWSWGDYTFFQQ